MLQARRPKTELIWNRFEGDSSPLAQGGSMGQSHFARQLLRQTCNFAAQIVNWYYADGSVWVELNDPDHTNMSIVINGVKMYLTSNSLTIYASLPSELSKLLK